MPVLAEASAQGRVLGLLVSRKYQDLGLCSFLLSAEGFWSLQYPWEGERVINKYGVLAELTHSLLVWGSPMPGEQ